MSVGTNGTAGGLIGLNTGSIIDTLATGGVTSSGRQRWAASPALIRATISGSFASGNVGSPGIVSLQAGGLVGNNSGTIESSAAFGSVQAGDSSVVGGFVATNQGAIANSSATIGAISGGASSSVGGLVGSNLLGATINNSFAAGNVTGGSSAFAGGLVGQNAGAIAGTTVPVNRSAQRARPARAAP